MAWGDNFPNYYTSGARPSFVAACERTAHF